MSVVTKKFTYQVKDLTFSLLQIEQNNAKKQIIQFATTCFQDS